VVIGAIAAPYGVRGTVRVRALGSGCHLREGIAPFVNGRRRRILSVRETPKGFLLDLEGVADRGKAAALRGAELLLDRGELDALDEGEFYVGDLLGLSAHDESGAYLGEVTQTFETPAHEVLVLRNVLKGEIYVPFTYEHVPGVDFEGKRIVVSLPEEA
jgi:16S rRNA processing protein RimM